MLTPEERRNAISNVYLVAGAIPLGWLASGLHPVLFVLYALSVGFVYGFLFRKPKPAERHNAN